MSTNSAIRIAQLASQYAQETGVLGESHRKKKTVFFGVPGAQTMVKTNLQLTEEQCFFLARSLVETFAAGQAQ